MYFLEHLPPKAKQLYPEMLTGLHIGDEKKWMMAKLWVNTSNLFYPLNPECPELLFQQLQNYDQLDYWSCHCKSNNCTLWCNNWYLKITLLVRCFSYHQIQTILSSAILAFNYHVRFGAHDPVASSQHFPVPRLIGSDHCIPQTTSNTCHFGDALTYLSNHQNLASV